MNVKTSCEIVANGLSSVLHGVTNYHIKLCFPFSYLDKKEFLERSDQRQFEKERDMRLASSSRR